MRRRKWLGAGVFVAFALGAPLVWAALEHVRTEKSWETVRAAAFAHETTSFEGVVALERGKTLRIRHDAESGRSHYTFRYQRRSRRRTEKRSAESAGTAARSGRPNSSDAGSGTGGEKSDRGKRDSARKARRGGWSRGFTLDGPSHRMPDPAAWCLDYEALRRNYEPVDEGETSLLGRRVRGIRLVSRHAGRPEVQLAIDTRMKLPLRIETRTSDGKPYRTLAFKSVRFAPQEIAPRRPSRGERSWRGRAVPADSVAAAAGFTTLKPAYLPPGFRVVGARVGEFTGPHADLLYTDGLTAFEVRQAPVQTPALVQAALQAKVGARHAERMMGRILDHRRRVIAQSGAGDDGVTVLRSCRRLHRSYELRVDDIDIRLTARADLAERESLRVLRSLRPVSPTP